MMTSFLVASLVISQNKSILPIKVQQGGGVATSSSKMVRGTAVQSEVYKMVENSLAFLPDGLGKPFGLAALIDREGYFLAHSSALVVEPITAMTADGKSVRLSRIGYDRTTQLVLLAAQNWSDVTRSVITISDPNQPSSEMTMATVNGAFRSTYSQKNIPGLAATNNRYLPLNEIQFESLEAPVGGALIFNRSGELTGILGATLFKAEQVTTIRARNNEQFGPQDLIVGYALSPKILRRVVTGFLSPSHTVQHPNIGVSFKDAPGKTGAVITEVISNQAAAKAGLKTNDLIFKVDNEAITSGLEFATKLFDKDPGEVIELEFLRNNIVQKLTVKVESGDLQAWNKS